MREHQKIQAMLYEYLREELDPDMRAKVDSHLASCPQCQTEAGELRAALELIPARSALPSEQRTDEFWQLFASRIEARVRLKEGEQKKSRPSLWEIIESTITARPRFTAVAAGALALFGVAILGWHLYTGRTPEPQPPQTAQPIFDQSSEQLNQYFRRSKMLLVGITNLKAPDGGTVDLSAERRVSRRLLEESKSLPRQTLDSRSVVLVDNLEKIFEELANARQDAGLENVETVRHTIRQENLLFKIRMAEAMRGSKYVMNTGNGPR